MSDTTARLLLVRRLAATVFRGLGRNESSIKEQHLKRLAWKAFAAAWLTVALTGCGAELEAPLENGVEEEQAPVKEKGPPPTERVLAFAGCTGPIPLTSNTPVNGLSANTGEWSCTYTLTVPAGAVNLRFDTAVGSGDADLYVKYGAEPNLGAYDCLSNGSSSSESCLINTAQAGTYYVKVYGFSAFSNLRLTGAYTPSGSAGCTSTTTLTNGVPVGNIGTSAGSWSCIYLFYIPTGVTSVQFVTGGGTGNGDLYVRRGSSPNESTYDCKSSGYSNTETCTVPAAQSGIYYARMYGQGTFSGASLTASYSITGYPGCTTTSALVNNTPVNNVGAAAGSLSCDYTLTVPPGATKVVFTSSSGYDGMGHLYVKRDSAPTPASYDCASTLGSGSAQTCTVNSPAAGVWHVRVYNASSSGTLSGVSLRGVYTPGSGGGGTVLGNNQPVSNLSGVAGSLSYWTLVVPSGQSYLDVTTTGGTGDSDLYVRKDTQPTEIFYDCRGYLGGNNEQCRITAPSAGVYHVMLRGYADYAGVQLKAVYSP
ncbi:hypothetical protein D7Y13_23640 [Corallococcus praedator]|uniref:Peptidase C-terminal archaeal/bacterial domain-containing protein n=1 Tax=Corallococcus praedator TaxID=2316724 RepID=A0ABX9QEB1_9BACT|nr:hypothetical protein D7X75_07300 [Corallococcus sp. CA031C]RKI02816.1 hypothetical protein D7Y13_23640 [Corallococcus praedator]